VTHQCVREIKRNKEEKTEKERERTSERERRERERKKKEKLLPLLPVTGLGAIPRPWAVLIFVQTTSAWRKGFACTLDGTHTSPGLTCTTLLVGTALRLSRAGATSGFNILSQGLG